MSDELAALEAKMANVQYRIESLESDVKLISGYLSELAGAEKSRAKIGGYILAAITAVGVFVTTVMTLLGIGHK